LKKGAVAPYRRVPSQNALMKIHNTSKNNVYEQ